MHPLQALGDPVRRALVAAMAEGEVTAGVLAARAGESFGIGVSAVSQHLTVLKAAGLAQSRVRGRERLYRLKPEGFLAVQARLDHYRPFWSAATDRLGAEVDRNGQAGAMTGVAGPIRRPSSENPRRSCRRG